MLKELLEILHEIETANHKILEADPDSGALHCLDFEAEDPLTPRWHLGQPCGKASWESLEGKPQIP